jgi:hypothetical protein
MSDGAQLLINDFAAHSIIEYCNRSKMNHSKLPNIIVKQEKKNENGVGHDDIRDELDEIFRD